VQTGTAGGSTSTSSSGGSGGAGTRSQATNLTPILFFSRRIGLQGGQEVPIVGGARITGRAGPYAIGLLNIQAGDNPGVGAAETNFSVVRLRRDILKRSTVGVIATHRAPIVTGGTGNTFGADASFAFFENLLARGYYARTDRRRASNDDAASYRAEVDYAADRYGATIEHLYVGRDFDPDTGFLRREDFRRTYGQLRFSPRPTRRFRAVRKFSYEASADYITTPQGALESRELQGTFRAELQTSDVFTAEYSRNFEWLPFFFEISRGVRIPPGSYHFQDLRAQYQIGAQRPISGTLTLARGSFYDGAKTELGYRGRVELSYRFYLEPGLTFNIVDLGAGEFTQRLVSSRATFTVNPRMFVSALVQYNSSTNALGGNYRFRWEYRPGSDLFVVFSDGRDTTGRGYPGLLNRTFVIKATKLFRF
jgi:hypothetical protein